MFPHEDCKALEKGTYSVVSVSVACQDPAGARPTQPQFSVDPSWSKRWTRNPL